MITSLALFIQHSGADAFADKAIEWIFTGALVIVIGIFAIRWVIDAVSVFFD